MIGVGVTLSDETRALMERAPAAVLHDAQREAVEAGVAYLWPHLVRATPANLGTARQSIKPEFEDDGTTYRGWLGFTGSAASYAAPLEEGSSPHWPPIAALAFWAQRKFSLSETEAQRVGYLVARKISRVGTKGAHMIERTIGDHGAEAERVMAQRFEEALRRSYGS